MIRRWPTCTTRANNTKSPSIPVPASLRVRLPKPAANSGLMPTTSGAEVTMASRAKPAIQTRLRPTMLSRACAVPRAPWASTAMFLAANILWNDKHNPDAAVSIRNCLIRDLSRSKEADASTLFISVVYGWTNRPDDARKVLTDFLAKHPDTRWRRARTTGETRFSAARKERSVASAGR